MEPREHEENPPWVPANKAMTRAAWDAPAPHAARVIAGPLGPFLGIMPSVVIEC